MGADNSLSEQGGNPSRSMGGAAMFGKPGPARASRANGWSSTQPARGSDRISRRTIAGSCSSPRQMSGRGAIRRPPIPIRLRTKRNAPRPRKKTNRRRRERSSRSPGRAVFSCEGEGMAGATGGGGLGWGCLKHRPKRDKSHAQQASRGWIGSYGVIAELAQKRFRIVASVPPKTTQPGVFRWVAWVAQAPVEAR